MATFPAVSASVGDADADARTLKLMEEMEADIGHISAKQQEILDRTPYVGVDSGGEEEDGDEDETEVFSTPPLTQQDLQRQRGQAGGEEEERITMCSVPFTQTPPPSSPSSSSEGSWEQRPRKPLKRVCTRKVRASTKTRTPTPSPTPALAATPTPALAATPALTPAPALAPTPAPPAATPAPSPSPELDPLARIVFMIPTEPLPTTDQKGILELGRRLGIF